MKPNYEPIRRLPEGSEDEVGDLTCRIAEAYAAEGRLPEYLLEDLRDAVGVPEAALSEVLIVLLKAYFENRESENEDDQDEDNDAKERGEAT